MPNNKKLLSRLENLFSEQAAGRLAKDVRRPGPASPPEPQAAQPAPEGSAPAGEPRAAAPVGWTWEINEQGNYTYCSPEVETVLGFTANEMLARHVSSLLEDAEAQRQLEDALGAQRAVTDIPATLRRKDGQPVTIMLNARPVREEDGRVVGYHGVSYVTVPAAEPLTGIRVSGTGELRGRIALPAVPARPDPAPAEAGPALSEPSSLADRIADAWHTFIRQQTDQAWGYTDSASGVQPIGDFTTPELDEALSSGKRILRLLKESAEEGVADTAGRALAIPLQLQNRTIGALNFFDENPAHTWSEDDLALVQAVAEQLALALENTRLFNETRDYVIKQSLLYEVTRAAATATSVTQALQSAADALGRVLPDSDIAILLLDKDGRALYIRAAVGFPASQIEQLVIPLGEGVTGWAAQNNLPVLVADVREEPRYISRSPDMLSEVAVPLALGQQVIGVLNVESPRANAFSERDVRLLQTLAGTLSAIIVNNDLLEQIDEERERLSLLYDVLRALTQNLDFNTVLSTALEFAPRLAAQHAYILVLGESKEEDAFQASVPGLSSLTPAQKLEFAHQLVDRGLERHVLESRQAIVVKDTRQDPRWQLPALDRPLPIRSVAIVPLQTQRGSLTGVLAYTHAEPNAFSDSQLLLVQSLANQVTVALENAYLHRQVNTQRGNAQTLARATQAVARALNESELLRVLAHELFETYIPEAVTIFRWEPGSDTLTPLVVRTHPEFTPADWPAVGRHLPASSRPDLLEVIQSRTGHVRAMGPHDPLLQSMVLPLMYGGEVEGVVEIVHAGQTTGLNRDDFELFRGILNSSTSAMQTARLYALQRETAERLAEVDRLKSQFLANMSHELRTPLNSIIGFSRVMLKGIDGPLNEVQIQDVTSINNAGQHLLGLINSVLDMAKIEAGKMELVFDEVEVPEIIDNVITTTLALTKDKPVRLEREVADDLPTVRADGLRVRQVLLNLLANAAKFTDVGRILVRARLAEDGPAQQFVEISVSDTGGGIAPEDLPKLFEAFSQVDASPTRKTGGTGLGLSICRHLVELHGGRIWVESDLGQGASFYFTLPVNQADGVPDPAGETAPAPPPGGAAAGPRPDPSLILAIDDDQGVLTVYRRYLESHGYRLASLTRSTEAVERAAELQPSAILLDVLMPSKDGWQVLAELKQSEATRHIPVIICSLVADRQRGLSMGAADYLVKPILESDLLRALNRLPAPKPGAEPS